MMTFKIVTYGLSSYNGKQRYVLKHKGKVIKYSVNKKKLIKEMEKIKKGEDVVDSKTKLTPDLINKIIADYELHGSMEKVARINNVGRKSVENILKENNIKINKQGRKNVNDKIIHSAYVLLKRSNKKLSANNLIDLMLKEDVKCSKNLNSRKLAKLLITDKRINVVKNGQVNFYELEELAEEINKEVI